MAIMIALPQQMIADIEINEFTFPDENFRSWIENTFYGADGNLTENEISIVTSIEVDGRGITNLKGIEYFTALKELSCSYNQLTALDVSNNTALTDLCCYENQLTSLDVSKNTALTWLWCSDNQLTALDVSNNTALMELDCYENQLTSLDVSKNTALTWLYCHSNQLTTLDVSNNTALTELICSNNQLTALDVSNNTALTELRCDENQLTTLDVSNNTVLKKLNCSQNQLTTLDVSNNTALTDLRCDENQLTTLDVSNNTALTDLRCGDNQLTTLDVSNNTVLKELYCYANPLTSLDVSNNTVLKELFCSNNQLTALDVSKNKTLTRLSCHSNQLTTLDVSNNTALTELFCLNNQLTALDVSKNTALRSLSCYENPLTALDVSKNTLLIQLYCSSNQLTALDVSKNTALITLSCHSNQLTTLDVSKNMSLKEVRCYGNQIKGAAMDALITGLPTKEGKLYTINFNDSNEQNVVTIAQVAAAKEKGWTILYKGIGSSEWQEYEGSEPETVDITPMEEGESVVFVNVLDGETSIYDIAVGNIYYCISSDNGSYDPAEGCLVVTKVTDDSAVDGQEIFDDDFKAGYTGIVFKVPSGEGTVKIDAATTGSMTLKVKIGSNEPIARTVKGKQTLSFPYSVSEDTYVYIYGGMNAAGAKGMRKAAGEDALKIYSIEVTSGTDGIDNVQSSKFSAQSPVYTLSGQRIISSPSGRPGGVPTKGIYIQNGRKVLVK